MAGNRPLGWLQGVDIGQDRLESLHEQHVLDPVVEQVRNHLHYVLSCSETLAYPSVRIHRTRHRKLMFFALR